MRVAPLAVLICLPVLAACDRAESSVGPASPVALAPAQSDAPPPPQFAPYAVDPGKTGAVAAKWLRYAGEPDAGGVPQHAVLLQLKDGAQKGAEAGIVITNVRGVLPPPTLGLDFKTGGSCDANGPQLVMTMSDGKVLSFACAAGKLAPSPVKGAKGWTRVTWGLPVSWPAGVTLNELRIILRWRGAPSGITLGSLSGIPVNPGWPGVRVYLADPDNNRIARIDNILSNGTSGSPTFFGTTGTGVGQFDLPMDVFVDRQSRIFVADANNNRVIRVNDMTGAGWLSVTGGPCPNPQGGIVMCRPVGLYVDAAGLVFVRDAVGFAWGFVMTGSGLPGPNFGITVSAPPSVHQDIFLDPSELVYSTSPAEQVVLRWGTPGGLGLVRYLFNTPAVSPVTSGTHLFIDGAGTIFYADHCRLYRMTDMVGTGKIAYPATPTCVFTGPFDSGPSSVATDSRGRVYFTAVRNGVGHVYRMNDMSGAGLVEIAAFGQQVHGVWVEDIEPQV